MPFTCFSTSIWLSFRQRVKQRKETEAFQLHPLATSTSKVIGEVQHGYEILPT